MKKIIVPGLPHHIIQRGLNSRQTFLAEQDYITYLGIMKACCCGYGVDVWAYCLMPDHVHLIALPQEENALSRCMGEADERYTTYINQKIGSKGTFWQGYASHLLDEYYLIACARYIEINPVKRGYVHSPDAWQWSSATAHITKKDDPIVKTGPLLERVDIPWSDFLAQPRPPREADLFYSHEKSGLPLGSDDFLARVEKLHNLTS